MRCRTLVRTSLPVRTRRQVTHQVQGLGAILVRESSPAPGKLSCPRKLPACARQTGRYHAASNGFAEKLQDQQDEPSAKKRGDIKKVVKDLGSGLAVGVVELKSADRSWAVSKGWTMIAYVLVRRQGYGLGEVAKYFARDAATVGTLIARLGERMEKDEELRREIARLTRKVER